MVGNDGTPEGRDCMKEIKIPITKDGKDICRIIFTQFDDGLFDVKIDPLKKLFRVQAYSLFDRRPREIFPAEADGYATHDISYHHGAEQKPIVIHIKNRQAKEELRYTSLPLRNILPPSVKNDFPLPLLKLEIPSEVVNASTSYRKKSYHHTLDIANSNVVEIYMANGRYAENMERYARIWETYFGLSFEYFCTNTILSGMQKAHTYIPGEPEARGAVLNKLDGMSLLINFYPEPQLDLHRNAMYFTFIENGYAEDILLNTILVFSPSDAEGLFPNICMGGSTLRDLRILTGKDKSPAAQKAFGKIRGEDGIERRRYTVTQATANMDRLSWEESCYLARKASSSSKRLYERLSAHSNLVEKTRKQLFEKSSRFAKMLYRARKEAERSRMQDSVSQWLLSDPAAVEEATYVMLSLYLGLNECRIGACNINDMFLHCWLLYDENWDVDVCGNVLNRFLKAGDHFRYPDVYIRAGLDPTYTRPDICEDTSHIKNYCRMTPHGYVRMSAKERETFLDKDDKLIRKVYQRLINGSHYKDGQGK